VASIRAERRSASRRSRNLACRSGTSLTSRHQFAAPIDARFATVSDMNNTAKWVAVVVLAIIGLLAAFVAFEYLTVSIHALPSYIPGHHKGRGHYHKRGAVAALVAIVAIGGAVAITLRIVRANQPSDPGSSVPDKAVPQDSADQLLANPPSEPNDS
jgi:uncharacterized membrane protein YidH (DUF202 family)